MLGTILRFPAREVVACYFLGYSVGVPVLLDGDTGSSSRLSGRVLTRGSFVGGVPTWGKWSTWQVLDGPVLRSAVTWGSERLSGGVVIRGDLTGGCPVLRKGSTVPVPRHVFLVLTFEGASVYVFHSAVAERGFVGMFSCADCCFAFLLKMWSVG